MDGPGGATISMRADRVFIDTNVFVYAFDESEPAKQRRARDVLVDLEDAVVSTQVLQELYVALTRGRGGVKPKLDHASAERAVATVADLTVVVVDVPMIAKAMRRVGRDKLSLWDALIVEAALSAGCHRLLSEDFQSAQRFDDLVVVNALAR